jgi:hypothetical protein
MKNSEIFLEKYKQLEETVRTTYKLNDGDSISFYLSEQSKYKRFSNDIRYCQKVRNLLCHEKKVNESFAVEASKSMIEFIDKLIDNIKKRPKCCDIQIKFTNVCWRSLNDTVKDTMVEMRNKLFTHIPILNDDGCVIGVFDENSVFTYIADEEIVAIDKTLKFSDIQKYLSLEGREMESFIYVKATSYVDELEEKMESALNTGKRIGLAFVTASGSNKDKIQGIITPWDII